MKIELYFNGQTSSNCASVQSFRVNWEESAEDIEEIGVGVDFRPEDEAAQHWDWMCLALASPIGVSN